MTDPRRAELQRMVMGKSSIAPVQEHLCQYIPNRNLQIWLQRISKMLFFFFGSALITMMICQNNPAIYSAILDFFKWILIPVKPFIVSSAGSQSSWLLGAMSTAGNIFNWLMVPTVAYLSIQSLRSPYLLGFENGELLLISSSENGNSDVVRGRTIARKRIPLAEIERVTVKRPVGTRSVNDYVVCFEGRNSNLRIRWGDITTEAERQRFLQAMVASFPNEDLSLFEPFKQLPQKQSYTELWLKELSGAPKRDKLTQLADGAELENGNYKIIRKAGTGGHGTVYLASSRNQSDALVVLKEFVLPIYPDIRVRKNAAERFHAEATMLRALNHPQIAKFIDLFIEDHRAYLVMELVEGHTLKDVVAAGGPLPQNEVVRLATQLCEILIYLHEQEPPILHRDLTPDNIMLEDSGLVKLIDFSVAEEASAGVTGSVVGKPNYISPEQFRGKPIIASDIYSFGATMYYLLLAEDPPPITVLHPQSVNDGISAEIDTLISKCTQLKTERRYSNFMEVLAALQALPLDRA